MNNLKRRAAIFCFGAGLTLIIAGLFPVVTGLPYASAQEETPVVTPESDLTAADDILAAPLDTFGGEDALPVGNNGYCVVCHNQPWRAITLPDGHVLSLYVDPQLIVHSVHGLSNPQGPLGCLDCHGEDAFPHRGPSPASARAYALSSVQMCNSCHEQQVADLETGLHELAIERGNLKAAVCTDCHGAHDIQPSTNRPQLVAGVCGDCHISTYDEWRSSPHVGVGPLGCVKCHSPHSQELRVGDVDQLCQNCHKAPSDIYIHEQHIGSTAYNITCADCHMFSESQAEIVAIEFKPTGHTMMMDARPCNSCHEYLETTGQWAQIADTVNDRIASERDQLRERASALESQISAAHEQTGISVQLTQGLIIGLGLGITLAVVLVPRFSKGSRRKEETKDE